MRAAPAPPMTRAAAVQPATEGPSSSLLVRQGKTAGASNVRYLSRYQEWQGWAKRYARQEHVARFAANIVADTCARCIVRVEEVDGAGDWQESEDPRFVGALDGYRNPRQTPRELVRLHAWHYQVAGESAQVITDGTSGIDWWIFSLAAIEFRKSADDSGPGSALIKLTPDGRQSEQTAFEVPRNQVVRFWIPDEEWQAYATSPMAATIDALHRYRSLARYAQRTADSALAMNGLLWAPGEAFEEGATSPDDDDVDGPEEPQSALEKQYYELAKMSFDDDDDIAAIAPPLMHWDHVLGEPKYIKLGDGLDSSGIEHRQEALADFARGNNLPASLVLGGGPGDANHWTEWLVDKKFFAAGVAPVMDMICHADLTQTYLVPLLNLHGLGGSAKYRIGYDPSPVIVEQDKSDLAIRLWLAGLLGSAPTLEAANFDPSDIATPQDVERLINVLAHGRESVQVSPGGDVTVDVPGQPPTTGGGASTVVAGPPAAPRGLMAASVGSPPTQARVGRLLSQLSRMRAAVGSKLLSGAEQAYTDALSRAGVKVLSRSKSRASKGTDVQVVAAVAEGAPLGPFLAAVGITESELLAGSFATFEANAARWLAESRRRQRAAIERAGLDPDELMPAADDHDEEAAAVIAAGLLALARNRLINGVEPHVLGPDGVPATPGEITGAVPARIVLDGLRVAEGMAHATLGATPDLAPTVTRLDGPSLSERLARLALESLRAARAENVAQLEADVVEPVVEYVWRWAFYGEPNTPFEPHQDLGLSDFSTTDPTGDPLLANDDSWPDGDLLQPGDHEGCTCEWEVVLPSGGSEVQLRLDAPVEV